MSGARPCAGSVTITGATGVITNNTGLVSSVVREDIGVYLLRLVPGIDATELHTEPTQEDPGTRGGVAVEIVSDSQVRIRAASLGGGEVLIQDGVGPATRQNAGFRVAVTVDLIPAVVSGMTLRLDTGGGGLIDRVIDTVAGDRRSMTFLVAFPFFETAVWDVYSGGAASDPAALKVSFLRTRF